MFKTVPTKFFLLSNNGARVIASLVMASFISTSAHADISLGLRAGLLGAGVEVVKPLKKTLNLRLAAYGYDYDYDVVESGNEWDFALELAGTGFLIDWHPFDSGFRASVGFLANSTNMAGLLTDGSSFDLNGETYQASDIGRLEAKVVLGSGAPYFGIGWGYQPGEMGFGYLLDIGVLFQDDPDVTLTLVQTAALPAGLDAATIAADLRAEEQSLENELESLNIYPVISLGLSYTF